MKKLLTFNGFDVWDYENGLYSFTAPFMVDSDGGGSPHGDKYHQSATSLRFNGQPLNADVDCYFVLPPRIIKAVSPIVLGCQGLVMNLGSGIITRAVVGDISDDEPSRQLGEGAIALARIMGVNPDPTTGGDERPLYKFIFEPGQPAHVGSKVYQLQAFGA